MIHPFYESVLTAFDNEDWVSAHRIFSETSKYTIPSTLFPDVGLQPIIGLPYLPYVISPFKMNIVALFENGVPEEYSNVDNKFLNDLFEYGDNSQHPLRNYLRRMERGGYEGEGKVLAWSIHGIDREHVVETGLLPKISSSPFYSELKEAFFSENRDKFFETTQRHIQLLQPQLDSSWIKVTNHQMNDGSWPNDFDKDCVYIFTSLYGGKGRLYEECFQFSEDVDDDFNDKDVVKYWKYAE